MMKRCLISTEANDYHAVAVALTLEKLGVHADVLCNSALSVDERVSLYFDDGVPKLRLGPDGEPFSPSDLQSAWLRREAVYCFLPDYANPSDRRHITSNQRLFTRSIEKFGSLTFAVNPPEGRRITSDKMNQLRVAMVHGLRVPKTLVTNDYSELQRFSSTVNAVCVKPFEVGTWDAGKTRYISLTSEVTDVARLDPRSVQLMTAIYQEMIVKAYEVRLTMFGNYHSATRINSQLHPKTSMDWRGTSSYLTSLDLESPPEEVLVACKNILRDLGLRFGTFDFAVTAEGEWVFFEVNEAGQFLWQEEYCPDCILLEPFSEFLRNASDDFNFDAKSSSQELSLSAMNMDIGYTPLFQRMHGYGNIPDSVFTVEEEA